MARVLRVEFPGAIYHVTVRMLGDARASLFRDDRDRSRLLAKLEERVEGFDIRLYALCLIRCWPLPPMCWVFSSRTSEHRDTARCFGASLEDFFAGFPA